MEERCVVAHERVGQREREGKSEAQVETEREDNSGEIKLVYRYKKPVPHNYIIGHISFDFCPRSSCFTDPMRLSGNTHPPSPRGRCCEDSVRNCRGSQSLHLFNLSSTFGRSIKRFDKLFVSVIAGSAIGSSLFFP